MSVEARAEVILLTGECRLEDAEPLAAALAERMRPVDVSQCREAHAAVVQALLSLGAEVVGTPADPFLRDLVAPNWTSKPLGEETLL